MIRDPDLMQAIRDARRALDKSRDPLRYLSGSQYRMARDLLTSAWEQKTSVEQIAQQIQDTRATWHGMEALCDND